MGIKSIFRLNKVDVRLSSMMFLQYMLYAVWGVSLATYVKSLGVGGVELSLIVSSAAIGSITAPILCSFADRYMSGNRVLFILNILTALFLFLSSQQSSGTTIFIYLMLAMFFYMPTWSLTNAIAMANAEQSKFSLIRTFGSLGWVGSGLFSVIAVSLFDIKFDGTNLPLMVGGVVSIIAALNALSLPRLDPVKSDIKFTVIDALGLRSLTLLRDKNFAIFVLFSFLAMIPFSIYWSYYSLFLEDKGFEYITLSMNLGQLIELFFLVMVSVAVKRVGIKWTLVIGLVALALRYVALWAGDVLDLTSLFFVGILVHGVIFGFFFLGGQIYIDKKSPKLYRTQAQGFIGCVTFGIGLVVGNFVNGVLIESLSKSVEGEVLYDWSSIWGVTAIFSLLLALLFALLFKDDSIADSKID